MGPPTAGARKCGRGTAEGGGVAALVALFLPVMVLAAGFVLDLGLVFAVRQMAYGAADLAALAAVQDLDLDRLALGELFLVAEAARRDARAYALNNLRSNLPGTDVDATAQVAVEVYNPEPGHPLRHRVTGRRLATPTVSVAISLPVHTYFLAPLAREIPIRVRADASVVRKAGKS